MAFQEDEDKFSKLPTQASPFLYDVYLSPCLSSFQFGGKSTVHLEVTQPTDFLRLHSNELDVHSASIELSDGGVFNNLVLEFDKKWMLLTVRFPRVVEPQKAKLSFMFTGQLNNKMQGFSRSVYKDASGNEKFMASTQFESTYARMAFPCWDEPAYKARFNVTLEVDEALTALSNMNVIEESIANGRKTVKYATTPVMSTYLVAFAVGDLEYIETKSKGGIDVRVYTVPGKKQYGQFALDLAAKCLDWYGQWFGIECPLPKCDLIAIPEFSMGAMENWGLVTYREIRLLLDPAKTSNIVKVRVARVVAHELAHFWFGNLVTMKWWTDLWLKEGFARFMEYTILSHICPEFKIWLDFATDQVGSGFELDGLRSSHPIEMEIDNPNDLEEIYDAITYAKSCCINRMLCNHLGEDVFQKGLCAYLKQFQYSNAQTSDLWNALSQVSAENVNALMSGWTKQMGYPLVQVTQEVLPDKRVLTLRQSRYISDGGQDDLNSLWQIPIGILTSDNAAEAKFKVVFSKAEEKISLEGVKPEQWIKLNAGLSGFYRVYYSSEMLASIITAVKSKQLGVVDRFNVANDFVALMMAGKFQATEFLEFLSAFVDEDEYIVWAALDSGIGALSTILKTHGDLVIKEKYDAHVRKIIGPSAERLGWEKKPGEDAQTGMLRALLLGRLSKSSHSATIEMAISKFYEHAEKNVPLDSDLRSMIYCTVGRSNSPEGISRIQKIFETVGFSEIETSCILAMGCCSDTSLLTQVFDYGIKQGKVPPQDYVYLFAGSQPGLDFSWNFIKKNLELLLGKFGSVNSILFQRCIAFATKNQSSQKAIDDVQKFCEENFDTHSLKVLDRPLRQMIESIRLNEKLLTTNVKPLSQYFA